MRIIDAHMHLGEDLIFSTDDSEELLLKTMDDNGIAAQMIMPGIMSRDQKKAHERIQAFGRSHPGPAYGIAVFQPLSRRADLYGPHPVDRTGPGVSGGKAPPERVLHRPDAPRGGQDLPGGTRAEDPGDDTTPATGCPMPFRPSPSRLPGAIRS